jgi:hypothetical protein
LLSRLDMRLLASALSLLSAACAPGWGASGWTEVRLRDPRQVEVVVPRPMGAIIVSQSGAAAGRSYLPESTPWPFAGTDCLGARIIRHENGAIDIQRRRCATDDDRRADDHGWVGEEPLVEVDGRVILYEPPVREDLGQRREAPYRWEGDTLRWPITLRRAWTVPGGRSRWRKSEPVVSIDLTTPRDNVVGVERHIDGPHAAW